MQPHEMVILFNSFENNLRALINHSGLAACQIDSIMQNVLTEIRGISKRELEEALKKNEELQKSQKNGEEKDTEVKEQSNE